MGGSCVDALPLRPTFRRAARPIQAASFPSPPPFAPLFDPSPHPSDRGVRVRALPSSRRRRLGRFRQSARPAPNAHRLVPPPTPLCPPTQIVECAFALFLLAAVAASADFDKPPATCGPTTNDAMMAAGGNATVTYAGSWGGQLWCRSKQLEKSINGTK